MLGAYERLADWRTGSEFFTGYDRLKGALLGVAWKIRVCLRENDVAIPLFLTKRGLLSAKKI